MSYDKIMRLRMEELTENPSARVPVCLALDTSGSMMGSRIQALRAAFQTFIQAVKEDELASISVETAVVTFGGHVKKVQDFVGIERQEVPVLEAAGGTPMGEAIHVCLEILDQAKRVYSEVGVDYYQPWLVLMTDGAATDDISEAVQKCHRLIKNRKLTLFPIVIGDDRGGYDTLSTISPFLTPLRIHETNIAQFFKWLAKSANKQLASNPGDKKSVDLGQKLFQETIWNDVFRGGPGTL